MKELTIEEKAQAYDEAIKRAKDALNDGTISSNTIAYLRDIFPELKESENELKWLTEFIRKEVYYLSMDIRDDEDRIKLKNLQKSLAWLEKQGEHADFLSKIQVGDKVTRNEGGVLVNISQLERIAKPRRVKPAEWSEEDESMLECALDMVKWFIGRNETKCRSVSNWLKSLKQRIGG